MTELHIVVNALVVRALLAKKLKDAKEAAAQPLPWYSIIARRAQQGRITSLESDIGKEDQKIGDDGPDRLAGNAADELWGMAANTLFPKRNPYGPVNPKDFASILNQALAFRDKKCFEVGPHSMTYKVTDLPEVDALVTEAFMQSRARVRIREHAVIAANTDLCSENTVCAGMNAMIIQHRASGLRAMFMLHGNGFGEVSSTPSNVKSIDPGYPSECQEWRDFLGLGIGRSIYAEGHSLFPHVRWISKASTPYAEGLRKKLHAANPYTWEDKCQWCETKAKNLGISSWKAADRSFFANHP